MKNRLMKINHLVRILSVILMVLLGLAMQPTVQAVSSPQEVAPAATVLSESFSSGAQPAGWSVRINNGSVGWRFNNPAGRSNNTGGGGGMAIADSDWGGYFTMNTELRTPAMNLSSYTNVQLQFKTHYRGYGSSVGDVDVSNNGGSSWTNVWRRTSDYAGTVNLNLSSLAAGRSSVIVRFHYYNAYWAWWWQVDDVVVGAYGLPPAPTNLSATAAGSDRINLSWRGNGATQFKIERSLTGSSGWSQIAAIVNGATTYSNSGLSSNTRYYYRVRAYNSYGNSAYSNTANALTGGGATSMPVDITVSLYRNPNSTDRAKYETVMRYFADGVYEASNGANKLRKITFYVNGANSDRSHVVWIQNCWPNAHISGYANPQGGLRIQMCDVFQSTNFLANECGYEGGGYTLAHEFGHYFYSLYDEYRGSSSSSSWIGTPLSGDNAVSNSIMNSQWNARQNCGLSSPSFNWLNFSTAINNPSSYNNAQRRCYGASGWDTLRRPVSQDPRNGQRASLPTRLYHSELVTAAPGSGQSPSLQLPGQRTQARSSLQFVWSSGSGMAGVADMPGDADVGAQVGEPGVYRQLVLDASAGMIASDQLNNAKLALGLLVDWLPPEDTLGIVTYHDAAEMVLPLTLNNPANRPLIKTAIQNIVQGGEETNIGAALQMALQGLTAPTIPTDTTRVVYLIGHRQSSVGAYPLDLISQFQDAGIQVYTFGYGGDDDLADMLHELAAQTGGMHAFVGGGAGGGSGLTSLFTALQNANQATSPLVDVTLKMGMTKLVGSAPFGVPIDVDISLDRLQVAVAYRGNPLSVTMQLTDPEGTMYPVPLYQDAPGIGTLNIFSTIAPLTGTWLLQGMATDPANPGIDLIYWAGSASRAISGTLAAAVESAGGSVINLPAPIVLRATLRAGVPVAGAFVTATVTLPDGNQMPVVFADDGIAPDAVAQDGFYAALINPPMVGEYHISVLFANYYGTAFFTESSVSLAIDPNDNLRDPQTWPVGFNFERFTNTQVQVRPVGNVVYLPLTLKNASTP